MDKTQDTLKKAADSITDEPIFLTVDLLNPTLVERLLIKAKLRQASTKFVITGTTIGNLYRISKLLLKIPAFQAGGNYLNSSLELMRDFGESIAEIIAIAVYNKRQAPPKKLIEFFLYNLTSKELLGVLNLILDRMDVLSFMNAIVSVRGMNVLETPKPASVIPANKAEASPSTQVEKIALGTLLEE